MANTVPSNLESFDLLNLPTTRDKIYPFPLDNVSMLQPPACSLSVQAQGPTKQEKNVICVEYDVFLFKSIDIPQNIQQ